MDNKRNLLQDGPEYVLQLENKFLREVIEEAKLLIEKKLPDAYHTSLRGAIILLIRRLEELERERVYNQ